MDTLFALVVGIDEYGPPVRPLRGCLNDVEHVLAYLNARVAPEHRAVRVLRNAEATRDAIMNGFREHLAQAGEGDTTLFWFSGHGSQSPARPGRELFEGNGMSQTIVCAGTRTDDATAEPVDLWDTELKDLTRECAERGAHVVVVLDCCHADGAARDAPDDDDTVRAAPWLSNVPCPGSATRDVHITDPADLQSIVLSACGVDELARERTINGTRQGVFSHGLLRQLNSTSRVPTYRDLMAGARTVVEDRVRNQQPVLRPMTEPLVDQPFLGGGVGKPLSPVRMRSIRGIWEVNVGTCHGIAGEHTAFGVVGETTPDPRQVRVLQTLPERCIVEPIGWQTDPSIQYPVVLTDMPLPRTTVAVIGIQPELLIDALNTAAINGGPSPYLRLADETEADIVIHQDHSGQTELRGPVPGPAVMIWPDVATPSAAAEVIATAEHLAKWLRIKDLHNPVSGLAGAVGVEVVAAQHDVAPPLHRAAMRTDETGALRLDYYLDGDTWQAPKVFLRIRNRSKKKLYCTVLDLTDRYQVDAGLLEGDWIGPGRAIWLDSEPFQLTLPTKQEEQPGAMIRDWLMVLAAEHSFDTAPFVLAEANGASTQHRNAAKAFADVLARLGLRTLSRSSDDAEPVPCDWTTSILPIVTSVPTTVSTR
jgi:hypothetical protein